MKDDDEEEENTFGVTRYPCMPSLVALQQMRNRLHLAFLGRKLMKWTALASGRELRRIAMELEGFYQGYSDDMRNAFILLARSRYFYPNLNGIVTEDVCKQAGVVVIPSVKAVSGVKVVQFEIMETEHPPYSCLGIDKGGQTIKETKKAWLDLLKRLIMMMQLRSTFIMVELANKAATKKWNVLSKLVVPRVTLSCRYITSELEEIEREDNFRLKRFKELKIKKAAEKNQNENPKKRVSKELSNLCICQKKSEVQKRVKQKNSKVQEIAKVVCPRCDKNVPKVGSVLPCVCNKSKSNISTSSKLKADGQITVCPICENENILTRISSRTSNKSILSTVNYTNIKANEVTLGVPANNMPNKTGSHVTIASKDSVKPMQQTPSTCSTEKNKKIRDKTSVCSVCHSDASKQKTEGGDIVPCSVPEKMITKNSMSKGDIEKLSTQIDGIINLIDDYKAQGLVSKDVEEFVRACIETKSKILVSNKNSDIANFIVSSNNDTSKASQTQTGFNGPTDRGGHFETKYKEIIKITRLPNADGTLCEEKQTITIKTERSIPRPADVTNKAISAKSSYKDTEKNKEYGKRNKNIGNKNARQTKSENIERNKSGKPALRKCMSAENKKLQLNNPRKGPVSQTASAESTKCCQTRSAAALSLGSGISDEFSEVNSVLAQTCQSHNTTKSNETAKITPKSHSCTPKSKNSHSSISSQDREKKTQKLDSCCTIKIVAKPDSISKKSNEIVVSASTMSILTKLLSEHYQESEKLKKSASDKISTKSDKVILEAKGDTCCRQPKTVIPVASVASGEQRTPSQREQPSQTASEDTFFSCNSARTTGCQTSPTSKTSRDNSIANRKQSNTSCSSVPPSILGKKEKKGLDTFKCDTQTGSCVCAKESGQACTCSKKDASTMTRRSDRYDVRSLKMIKKSTESIKIKTGCTCFSEPNMTRNYKSDLKPIVRSCSMY